MFMKDTALQMIIQRYPGMEGSKILRLLGERPNLPILSTVLELALYRGITIPEAEQGYYHPLGLPLTDAKTLREIDQRLIHLTRLKEEQLRAREYLNTSPGSESSPADKQSNPYDAEISALIRYRKECTKPWGGIKHSDDELRRAYRRHYAAIHRLFNKAGREGLHEAVAIVKHSLRLGYSSLIRDPGSS
jgi:hypothetical protein